MDEAREYVLRLSKSEVVLDLHKRLRLAAHLEEKPKWKQNNTVPVLV